MHVSRVRVLHSNASSTGLQMRQRQVSPITFAFRRCATTSIQWLHMLCGHGCTCCVGSAMLEAQQKNAHAVCSAMLEAFDEDHGVPRLRSSPQDGP